MPYHPHNHPPAKPGTFQLSGGNTGSVQKRRRKRGTKKVVRGGLRERVFRKFKIPFWQFVKTMTPSQQEELTQKEKEYVAKCQAQLDSGHVSDTDGMDES
jgi:hypothetical protein